MIYVDALAAHGWVLRGRKTTSCHMFTDGLDLEPLHALAERIGLRRAWLHDAPSAPHYDLTPSRRLAAVAAGAIEVGRAEAVQIWRERRALLTPPPPPPQPR